MLLLELFSALLRLLLHLRHMHIVVGLSFVLRVRLLACDLVDSRLELLRVLLHVPFVLVALLLQELVLSFPECGFLIVLVDLVLQLRLKLIDAQFSLHTLALIQLGCLMQLFTILLVICSEL
jgi:hypothetical protein